jgi:carboxymethylenebutenolidase
MQAQTIDSGQAIQFPSGSDRISGVLYTPETSPSAAIVLIPDVRGISALYREIASRFARAGIATLVLDIYSREGAPNLADMAAVFSWIDALPDRRVLADVAAAVGHLRRRADVRRSAVGVVGFCLGGQYAMMAACRLDGLAACVAFYGMLRHRTEGTHKLPTPLETTNDLRCPLLGLFGADDELIPCDDVKTFGSDLARAGKTFDLYVFERAGHAFMNDRRPDAFRPNTAAKAFDLAVKFLHRTLA